jgi:two-component system, LytTR family, sensor kinase
LQTVLENVVKHNYGSTVTPILTEIMLSDNKIIVTNNKNQKLEKKPTTSTGIKNLSARYKLLSDLPVLISDNEKYSISLPVLNSVE